jgi:hypothetical protein
MNAQTNTKRAWEEKEMQVCARIWLTKCLRMTSRWHFQFYRLKSRTSILNIDKNSVSSASFIDHDKVRGNFRLQQSHNKQMDQINSVIVDVNEK